MHPRRCRTGFPRPAEVQSRLIETAESLPRQAGLSPFLDQRTRVRQDVRFGWRPKVSVIEDVVWTTIVVD